MISQSRLPDCSWKNPGSCVVPISNPVGIRVNMLKILLLRMITLIVALGETVCKKEEEGKKAPKFTPF